MALLQFETYAALQAAGTPEPLARDAAIAAADIDVRHTIESQQVCSGFFPRLFNVCALFLTGIFRYTICVAVGHTETLNACESMSPGGDAGCGSNPRKTPNAGVVMRKPSQHIPSGQQQRVAGTGTCLPGIPVVHGGEHVKTLWRTSKSVAAVAERLNGIDAKLTLMIGVMLVGFGAMLAALWQIFLRLPR